MRDPDRCSSKHPSAAATNLIRQELRPLTEILNAFKRRHYNQHRASHWWADFEIFHRSLRGLSDKSLASSLEPPASERVQWLRDRIIPRVVTPVTQLVADNQHAALGLLLLSVLARASSIIAENLPKEIETPADAVISKSVKKEKDQPLIGDQSKKKRDGENAKAEAEADRGVAVSRDNFTGSKPPLKAEPAPKRPATSTSLASESKPKKKKSSKSKKSDEFSSMFGSL